MIRVRIPLKPTAFSINCVLEKNDNKQKTSCGCPIKNFYKNPPTQAKKTIYDDPIIDELDNVKIWENFLGEENWREPFIRVTSPASDIIFSTFSVSLLLKDVYLKEVHAKEHALKMNTWCLFTNQLPNTKLISIVLNKSLNENFQIKVIWTTRISAWLLVSHWPSWRCFPENSGNFKNLFKGWEPLSSGYGRRLTIQRLWVRMDMTFFHINLL